MEDSLLLGRLVDPYSNNETQEEINEESLLLYNQRDLLDKIKDKKVSKYEIKFLYDNVEESGSMYFAMVLKEIIRAYNLNTLKGFLDYTLLSDEVVEVKKLLLYLKIKLPDLLIDKPIPHTREDILNYFKKRKSPKYLIYAIETMDRESFDNFKNFLINRKY